MSLANLNFPFVFISRSMELDVGGDVVAKPTQYWIMFMNLRNIQCESRVVKISMISGDIRNVEVLLEGVGNRHELFNSLIDEGECNHVVLPVMKRKVCKVKLVIDEGEFLLGKVEVVLKVDVIVEVEAVEKEILLEDLAPVECAGDDVLVEVLLLFDKFSMLFAELTISKS